jgi:hypothetical protein
MGLSSSPSPVSANPSFAVPKLKLISSSPSAPVPQDPTPAVAAHRSSLPTSERCCPEPLFRLPAAPSFGYAPPPPALPGVTPKSRWCSQGAPHRRLATVGPSANMPPRRPACGDHAADARCTRVTSCAHGPQRGWTGPPSRGPTGLSTGRA